MIAPSHRRVYMIVVGAVKNARDAHPRWHIDQRFASSIAKRAAGTLTAEMPDVLAARLARRQARRFSVSSTTGASGGGLGPSLAQRRQTRMSMLKTIWRRLSRMAGAAKENPERRAAIIDVLRMIAEMQKHG